MRNLSVIKGLYQGNGVTRRWAIPFEYNDTAQIFVTITTFDEGDYTYRVLDSTEYTIDEDSVEIVYPKTDDDEPIPSTQYLTVWRDTDLLQLMDLTNQGAAWPDSIEASLDKLHQIVQELAEGLSRSLKVDIGDPQTPDEKLVAIQDYVLAAAESSRSASASEANAQRSAEAAATSEANAAESERLAGGYADTASDAASRAEDSAISARAYNAPDYDNETTYQAGDVVTYTDGNSYRALQETTGNEPPNIIYWQKVTDYVGDDFFEVDEYGYIVPMDSPSHSRYWRVDQNGYIVPIEGGDGGYRPDTRQLSAEYLNVTNEGYIKHLRADDIAAQEVDADEMTAEVAAFNTLTANSANVTTFTANSANVTTLTSGSITVNDIIAKGPVVDVRAFGAVGDGVHDDTQAIQAAIDAAQYVFFPNGTYLISETINITRNQQYLFSAGKSEYTPCIYGKTDNMLMFSVTGYGLSVYGLHFRGENLITDYYSDDYVHVNAFVIDRASVNGEGNIDAYFHSCAFQRLNKAIDFYGRNVDFIDTLFSHCIDGIEQHNATDSTDIRGLRVLNCRFHTAARTGGHCIKTPDNAMNTHISGCMIDALCGNFYYGGATSLSIVDNIATRLVANIAFVELIADADNGPWPANITGNIVTGLLSQTPADITTNPSNYTGYFVLIDNLITCNINNNILSNCRYDAIKIKADYKGVISGNTIVNSGMMAYTNNDGCIYGGITLDNDALANIDGNVIRSTNYGGDNTVQYGIKLRGNNENYYQSLMISNNNIYAKSGNVFAARSVNANFTYNKYNAAHIVGLSTALNDPLAIIMAREVGVNETTYGSITNRVTVLKNNTVGEASVELNAMHNGDITSMLTVNPGGRGTVKVNSSAYDGGHLELGNYHIWIDSNGRLRIKSSAPSSDTDGTIVGQQS